MLIENQKVVKITAAGTSTVFDATCFLLVLVVSIVTPGTLAITIQDKDTPVNKLVAPFDVTPPTAGTGIIVRDWTAPRPVRMDGGIDIVTVGAGEAYLWIWYLYEPEPQT